MGDAEIVIGIGPALAHSIKSLHPFPASSGSGFDVPSTQTDVWCWIRGNERDPVTRQRQVITKFLAPAFRPDRVVDGFKYDGGRDLSGYEDGTENPVGEAAVAAAISEGSSFVAVQQWLHDLDYFETLEQDARDNIIGRRLSDNAELDDAPLSAHVKRTAQETFEPEAFLVRRSMPWSDATGKGLMFVAFGNSFDAFEAQLARMTGQEDQIIDGLFRFTRPVSGSYFWCPPTLNGKLDLGTLNL
ncbi:MAG: Dyp-type peroxidase [Rhodospirillales bacterium]|nr:Dyp-type peroxidase [Rhodospirillales bacterium]